MKGHISMKLSIYTTIGISVFSTLSSAQDLNNPSYGPNLQQRMMMDRQEQNYQSTENMQIQRQRQQAWQAKENAIQAQIERYRSTPYYGSLAVNMRDKGTIYWSGGGIVSDESSIQKALALCGHADCKILKTFSNACAAITYPTDRHEMFVVVDRNPNHAGARAAVMCAQKYGENNCRISSSEEKNSYAYCSGYDYGAYNQR